MLKGLFDPLFKSYHDALVKFGYWLIAGLMAMESSIIPLPSELVIPPAAYYAHTDQIPLSLIGIVVAGTIGSWLGATVMYWAARLAGRPLFLRYGRWVLITPVKIEGAERWADHYGSVGIFISRLLPVVRHLIGIPAGVVKMDYRLFSLFTLLGSAVWCSVLCYVGIVAGNDKNLIAGDMTRVTLWLGGGCLVLGGLYYFAVHRQMRQRKR